MYWILFFFRASIDFFSIQKKVISSIGILISFAAAFLTSSSSAFPIFPLQWAWTSGYLAGKACGMLHKERKEDKKA